MISIYEFVHIGKGYRKAMNLKQLQLNQQLVRKLKILKMNSALNYLSVKENESPV